MFVFLSELVGDYRRALAKSLFFKTFAESLSLVFLKFEFGHFDIEVFK